MRKAKMALAALVVLLGLSSAAKADPITINILENGSRIAPGATVTLTGFITNNTSGTLYVRTFGYGFNPGVVSATILFPTQLALAPGETSGLLQFLTFTTQPSLPDPSFQHVSIIFGGGPNPGDRQELERYFVNIAVGTSPIPEPATLLLLSTGIAGVGAAVRRRRTASGGHG